MYTSYIEKTLDSCENRIQQKGLNQQQVISYTVEIANMMFTRHGLEASVTVLAEELPHIPVEDVIDILKFARLGRTGSGDDNVFSFSHRRFTEYFTVKKLIKDNKKISFDAIPQDSQWRDALVLYCEVAEEDKATEIAEFCWSIISENKNLHNGEVIHCLRFLRDAFGGRPECINSFRDKLADFLEGNIRLDNDVLSIQLVIDILPLLSPKDIDRIISKALLLKNNIVNDSSINIYRSLPDVSDNLLKTVSDSMDRKSIFYVLENKSRLLFSFSLSDAFKTVGDNIKTRVFLFYCSLLVSLLIFFITPILSSIAIFIGFLSFFLMVFLNSHRVKTDINSNYVKSNLFFFLASHLAIISIVFSSVVYKQNFSESNNANKVVSSWAVETCSENKCYKFPDYFDELFSVDFFNYDKINREGEDGGFSYLLSSGDYYNAKTYMFSYFLCGVVLIISLVKSFAGRLVDKSILRAVIPLYVVVLFIIGLFFYFRDVFLIYEFFIVLVMLLLLVLWVVYMIFSRIKRHIKNHFLIKSISKFSLKNKETIHGYFSSSEFNEKVRLVIIQYLEKNVKYPQGEWPDLSIFAADKNKNSFIRLARLERKWREVS